MSPPDHIAASGCAAGPPGNDPDHRKRGYRIPEACPALWEAGTGNPPLCRSASPSDPAATARRPAGSPCVVTSVPTEAPVPPRRRIPPSPRPRAHTVRRTAHRGPRPPPRRRFDEPARRRGSPMRTPSPYRFEIAGRWKTPR